MFHFRGEGENPCITEGAPSFAPQPLSMHKPSTPQRILSCQSWLPVALLPFTVAFGVTLPTSSTRAQTVETHASQVLLDVEGSLSEGDATLDEESEAFDPYLKGLDESGELVAESGNADAETLNSSIGILLPQDAIYRIWANTYDSSGLGTYRLVAQTVDSTNAQTQQSEANRLFDEAFQLWRQSRWNEALENLITALEIYQAISDHHGEGRTLTGIGAVYRNLGHYEQALQYYEQSLTIRQEIGDRAGEGRTLNNIGSVYHQQESYDEALQQFQQALTIRRAIGERSGEANSLWWIGYQLQQQNQSELAIVFYKDAVNVQESIRSDLRGLPQDLQESYTRTVEDDYRALADLLLQQDRILEAQQVLDLLKVQELDDYLRGVRGVNERVSILRPEQEILTAYDELQKTAIDIGQELTELRQRRARGNVLSTSDEQRLETLKDLQEDINRQFTAFLYSAEVEQYLANLTPRVLRQNIDLADLAGLQDDLADLNAVLLYPLILEDRLELVITTPVSPPLRRTVDIKRTDLNRIISGLRQDIRDPSSDPKDLAQ